MRFAKQFQKGQSLLEVLVALGLSVAAVLGVLALVTRATGLNRVSTDQYVASYLALEGMELVRNLFDHSYLEEALLNPNSQDFYGWAGSRRILPGPVLPPGDYGVYVIDYNDTVLTPISCLMSPSATMPTQSEILGLMSSCTDPDFGFLLFDASTGVYSHDSGSASKFKRVIIIDYPPEFNSAKVNLDYRVTSAVGWESRGGSFVVQLQDHFLPWRVP